ncbi:hypothetical protein CF319_g8060 [Tilletia indica]|nr:hypothetical protein CF319_g8060 [Tilletia indica]
MSSSNEAFPPSGADGHTGEAPTPSIVDTGAGAETGEEILAPSTQHPPVPPVHPPTQQGAPPSSHQVTPSASSVAPNPFVSFGQDLNDYVQAARRVAGSASNARIRLDLTQTLVDHNIPLTIEPHPPIGAPPAGPIPHPFVAGAFLPQELPPPASSPLPPPPSAHLVPSGPPQGVRRTASTSAGSNQPGRVASPSAARWTPSGPQRRVSRPSGSSSAGPSTPARPSRPLHPNDVGVDPNAEDEKDPPRPAKKFPFFNSKGVRQCQRCSRTTSKPFRRFQGDELFSLCNACGVKWSSTIKNYYTLLEQEAQLEQGESSQLQMGDEPASHYEEPEYADTEDEEEEIDQPAEQGHGSTGSPPHKKSRH